MLLAQEVRNPRAGRYRFTVFAAAMADSVETFREYFAGCFRCRMILFGYADLAKDPRRVREFAALEFEPGLLAPKEASGFTRFELTATLKSQDDGAFQLSRGVGVAVMLQCKSEKPWLPPADGRERSLHLCIDRVEFEFDARRRNDDVMI